MSKYTVKSFSGKFTLVAMNSPSDFFRLPRSIKLTIKFHNGRIDDDSKSDLLKLINEIKHDITADSKLIAPHWYDDKGKVEYVEKEFDSNAGPDDQGRIIESKTLPLTSANELEEFLSFICACLNEHKNTKAPNIYTPLLNAKRDAEPQLDEQAKPVAENGVVARARNMFKCCFGN